MCDVCLIVQTIAGLILICGSRFAVNKTNSKKALPPFSNQLTVGNVTGQPLFLACVPLHERYESLKLDSETDWLIARDNTDGMFLQQTLVDLLEAFPHFDLSSEKGTEATIHAIEVRLGNAAIFDGPSTSLTSDHQSGPDDSFIGKDDRYRLVLGCGVVVCILAVVYKYGMVRMPLLKGGHA